MKAELIVWEQVKLDCKYPKDDNNNNYTYGLNLLDKDDIIDVQRFKNDQERFDFINKNKIIIK